MPLSSSLQPTVPPDSSCHISQFPTEILCEIFLNYNHIYSQDAALPRPECLQRKVPYISEHSASDPGVLAQVCSAWRRAALGLPTLWSTIIVVGPRKSHIRIAKLWLERANGQPLDLTFKTYPQKYNARNAIVLMCCFFSYAATWKSIRLNIQPEILEPITTLTKKRKPCPILEFAGLSFPSNALPFPDDVGKMWRFLSSSPALRKVSLRNSRVNACFSATESLRLTSVLISSCTAADLFLVMSRCPLLEDLETEYLSPFGPSFSLFCLSADSIAITHRGLQRLAIGAAIDVALDNLFEGLTLPSLQVLSLTHSAHSIDPFRDFLQRSECRLRKLKSGFRGDLGSYVQLEVLQSLVVLHFTWVKVTDSVLEALLQRTGNGFDFLPHLEALHLAKWTGSDGMLSRFFFSARSCFPANPDALTDAGRGRLALSFHPVPEGPKDRAFVAQYYPWLETGVDNDKLDRVNEIDLYV